VAGEKRRCVRFGYKRLSIQLPEELVSELYALAGRNVSGWIEVILRERLEQERSKRLLAALPPQLKDKLLAAAGGEAQAQQLLVKLIERSLAELEDEDLVQEVLGLVHEKERLTELRKA